MLRIQLFLLLTVVGFIAGPKLFALAEKEAGSSADMAGSATPRAESVAASAAAIPAMKATKVPMPEIEGKAAFVWDIKEHRVIFAKREHDKLPLASVTKMMTALVASETLPPDAEVRIAPEDLWKSGDSGLAVGERWLLRNLIDFTLVGSSNDGASAIAAVAGRKIAGNPEEEHARAVARFVERMNARAHVLGLDDTRFRNPTGLDEGSVTEGAYGSARDMAMLFEYIWRKHPALFEETTEGRKRIVSGSKIAHTVTNTNPSAAQMTGIIGSKTGFTDLAGGNLVIILDIGVDHPVVVAVLGSSREGRFADVAKLAESATNALVSNSI